MSVYFDPFKCPKCGSEYTIPRRSASAGKVVTTYCSQCQKNSKVLAGPIKDPSRR